MTHLKETGIRPEVVSEIQALAMRHGLERVILFGSRARGDFSRASDIDLAAAGGDVTGFALDVEETTSTLLMFDVINLGTRLSEKLRRAIEGEGILLYEKVGKLPSESGGARKSVCGGR